jgi:hypothetical protein
LAIETHVTHGITDYLQLNDSTVRDARGRAEALGGDEVDHLLAAGLVAESDLLTALAHITGCSPADPADYPRIERKAFESLPVEEIRRHALIPFRKHRHSLGAFVVKPLDEKTLDELGSAHDVTISQFVWPRLRYLEALHVLLGDPLADFVELFIGETRPRVCFNDTTESDARNPNTGESATDEDDLDGRVPDVRLSSTRARRPEPTETRAVPGFDGLGLRWSLEQACEFIAQCYDRDALIHTLLGFSERWLANRMILVLGNQQAQPYLAKGWPELDAKYRESSALRRVKVDVPSDALLFDEDQIGHSLAERPEDVGLGQLFVELTLFPPDRLLVQTVRIGPRPAMALVGEPHADASSSAAGLEATLEELEHCARMVGEQLAEMVRLAKAGQLPPPEARIPAIPEAASSVVADHDDDAIYVDETNDQSMVPGLAVESSASEEIDAKPEQAGATAYGLPFVDEAANGTLELDDLGATAYGLPFADETTAGDPAADPADMMPYAEIGESDELDGSDENSEAVGAARAQQEAIRSTLSGGFSVIEFENGLHEADEDARDEGSDEVTDGGEIAEESEESEESDETKQTSASNTSTAPMAQILRPISLKSGRQTGRHAAARKKAAQPPAEEAPSAPAASASSDPADDSLIEQFPGALLVDRYQYSIETLPPIDEHGPVLAEMVASGAASVGAARKFLDHTSVELRFYATYLFTKLPVDEAIEDLTRRLFDRDYQTREIAKKIVLDYHLATQSESIDWFNEHLRAQLQDIVAAGTEDVRVEVAADLLGAVRDRQSVDILINGLEKYHGRVKDSVFRALRAITYKDFAPSHAEWINWWSGAPERNGAAAQSRTDWIIAALNSNSLEIRRMAFDEVREIDGIDLNYHPDQPPKLRARAQDELRQWLTNRATE